MPRVDTLVERLNFGLIGLLFTGTLVFLQGRYLSIFYSKWVIYSFWILSYSLAKPLPKVDWKIIAFGSPHSPKWIKQISIFVGLIILLRISAILSPQNHGDSYLYHLSLTDLWLNRGLTGVSIDNLASGYAFAVEHFFLLLRLFTHEEIEQNILAQTLVAFYGYLNCSLIVWTLLKKTIDIRVASLVLLCFCTPSFTAHALNPKPDALGIACLLALLYFSLNKVWPLVLSICFVSLTSKLTVGIGLLACGATFVALPLIRSNYKAAYEYLKVYLIAAFLAFIGLLPYLINNFFATGNPTIPLFNNIFLSSFAPQTTKAIVSEMSPFSLSTLTFIDSWKNLFLTHPETVFALLLFWPPLFKSLSKLALALGLVGVINFVLTLVLVGPYGGIIEERHFRFTIYCLVAFAFLIISLIRNPLIRRSLFTVFILFAFANMQIEVSIDKLVKKLRTSSLSDSFFKENKYLSCNNEINKAKILNKNDRVFALTTMNARWYLRQGNYLHPSFSFPYVMDSKEWNNLLRKNPTEYILTNDTYFSAIPRDMYGNCRVFEPKSECILCSHLGTQAK